MDLRVKKSNVSGKGVFADRDFKKGEVIIDYSQCSKFITKADLKGLSDYQMKYVSKINGKYLYFYSPARYVNHSCEPNAYTTGKQDIALKPIREGEEIFVDYTKEGVKGFGDKCKCSAEKHK